MSWLTECPCVGCRDVLGAEVSGVEALPEHGVYTVFVKLDNTKLELLHPLGDNSPIQVRWAHCTVLHMTSFTPVVILWL